jgi:hypothetical protein
VSLLFAALLGVLWHVALVLLNDGVWRYRYRTAVAALAALPSEVQSAARTAVMERTRRRLSPFGRTFSKGWRRRHPGRGPAGRAFVSNPLVNALGTSAAAIGSVLLFVMTIWAALGTTPVWMHIAAIVGGAAGGLFGGLLCESGGLFVVVLGQLAGAALGASVLAGMAAMLRRI